VSSCGGGAANRDEKRKTEKLKVSTDHNPDVGSACAPRGRAAHFHQRENSGIWIYNNLPRLSVHTGLLKKKREQKTPFV